jgi:hypothetical protein
MTRHRMIGVRLQRLIVDLPRFEVADVTLQHCNVPFDDLDAPPTARLLRIPRGTIGESRSGVRLPGEVGHYATHLGSESFLGLLLSYRANPHVNPNTEISLVDEASAIG